MNTQPIADTPYEVGNNPELDEAILATLAELTTRWQSFTADPMPDSKRVALQRLIMCGFAKTKVAYKVANTTSSDWIRQRYVVSGQFLGIPLSKHIASQCPRDWFEDDHVTPRPGVTITTESNEWMLAITDDGDKLRKLPENRWLVLNTVCCHNAQATILKDGSETGRGGPHSADTSKNTEVVPTSRDQFAQALLNHQFSERNSGKTIEVINREFFQKNRLRLGKNDRERMLAFRRVKDVARRCKKKSERRT